MAPTRRSKDETRQLMLDAGAEVLVRDGISVGASTFRYSDAFALLAEQGIKITRGSVHRRIWSSQEAWQLDVLSEAIRRRVERRRTIVTNAVAAHISDMPMSSVVERKMVLAEVSRIGALAFIDAAASGQDQELLPAAVAAWKASSDELPEHAVLGHFLGETITETIETLIADLTVVVGLLGLEPNPARGMPISEAARAYAAITTSLAYSLTIRIAHDPDIAKRFSARCPDGVHRDWNTFGMSNWLVMQGLFSMKDDNKEPSAH